MKALFVLTDLILLAAASWLGVGFFYMATADNLKKGGGKVVFQEAGPFLPTRPTQSLNAYAGITRRNLFNTGTASEKATENQKLDIEALKETALDLRLWGTVILGGEKRDYAVIEDKKTRRQELYRVGDPLQKAVITAILREKVVLNIGGKDEILTMEDVPSARRSGARPVARAVRAPIKREMVVQRETVADAMDNIGELMKQVRIRPYFEGGQPSGLSLTGVRPGSIFRRMGIRSGDVLQTVNGDEIRSVDDVVNLYQTIGSADSVALQIKRRGRLQDIHFQIR